MLGLGELLLIALICGLWVIPLLGVLIVVIKRGRRTQRRDED
jgi:hypothetical protein